MALSPTRSLIDTPKSTVMQMRCSKSTAHREITMRELVRKRAAQASVRQERRLRSAQHGQMVGIDL
jgi:hypothetical protein